MNSRKRFRILCFFTAALVFWSVLTSGCTVAKNESGKLRYTPLSVSVGEYDLAQPPLTSDILHSGSVFRDHRLEFLNFRRSGTVGFGRDPAHEDNAAYLPYLNPANTAYTEMYFGIYSEIEDDILTVRSYTHLDDVMISDITIIPDRDDINPVFTYENCRLTAMLSDDSFSNGMYSISASFRYLGETYTCCLYLWINCRTDRDDEFYICECADISDAETLPSQRRRILYETLGNDADKPQTFLDTNVAYPIEATGITAYDAPYWVKLSDEIVKGHENDTKAFRAALLHDYMTSHLAYDRYNTQVLQHPRYTNDYKTEGHYEIDPKLYVSETHVGVCRDFAEIFGILCRAQGIPCAVCLSENNAHAWNAVYINGSWTEVDVTHDTQRFVDSPDMTDIKRADYFRLYSYENYFRHCLHTPLDHISQDLLSSI